MQEDDLKTVNFVGVLRGACICQVHAASNMRFEVVTSLGLDLCKGHALSLMTKTETILFVMKSVSINN